MKKENSNKFTEKQFRQADLFKALAHPARIAIVELLVAKKTCICGDIVEELPLSQSTISQHLKELKRVGIVKGEIEGVKTCYCIDDKVWGELDDTFRLLMNSYSLNNKCC